MTRCQCDTHSARRLRLLLSQCICRCRTLTLCSRRLIDHRQTPLQLLALLSLNASHSRQKYAWQDLTLKANTSNNKKANMLRAKRSVFGQENELLVLPSGHGSQLNDTTATDMQGLGIPRSSRRLWRRDFFLTAICLQCFALALMTVFLPPAAVWLGQVNQLISLGVLLQLMAICTQKQLQYFLLSSECLWNNSSLQNYESIVSGSFASANTSFHLRLVILLYVTLPLGLGVAYKNFTGGKTISSVVTMNGTYGITGPSGNKGLGATGIALFSNTTSSWWSDSRPNGTYGFNLFVESTQRTALLDGPTEEFVLQLQKQLKGDETLVLSGLVNSTTCDMVFDLSNSSRLVDMDSILPYFSVYNDWVFGQNYSDFTNITDPTEFIDKYAGIYLPKFLTAWGQLTFDNTSDTRFGMIVPLNTNGWSWNSSFIMTSRWNESKGESFSTAAQGFWLYYGQYKAQWQISRSTVRLLSAEAAKSSDTYQPYSTGDFGCDPDFTIALTIDCNYSLFQLYYPRIFSDFDWKYFGNDDYENATPQQRAVKSDTTLVGTMVWARLTTGWGHTNLPNNMTKDEIPDFYVYSSPSTCVKTTPTLKRSRLLAAVLATNPIILLTTLVVRVLFLHRAPISRDFGFVSLLAGIDPDSLRLVKGAAYSGKLSNDVRLRFSVLEEDDELLNSRFGAKRLGRVVTKLEASGIRHRFGRSRHDRTEPNVTYL